MTGKNTMTRTLMALGALLAAAGCTAPVDGAGGALVDAPCEYDGTLFAGQHIEAGSVSATGDDTSVTVDINGDNGWQIAAYHVYVGFGPPPTNGAGAPVPGHFPYQQTFDPPTDSASVTVPLGDIAAACGDTLVVAVHTESVRIVDGVVVDTQTGWAEGPHEYRRQWGWYFDLSICCEEDDACVLPKWIYRDHADWWSTSSVEMGGYGYDETEMMTLLWTPPWGDASIELAHQVIGAELNLADGASMSASEAADLAAAYAWMAANVDADGQLAYGIYSIHPAYAEGHALAARLQDYNEGRGSEPLCAWY